MDLNHPFDLFHINRSLYSFLSLYLSIYTPVVIVFFVWISFNPSIHIWWKFSSQNHLSIINIWDNLFSYPYNGENVYISTYDRWVFFYPLKPSTSSSIGFVLKPFYSAIYEIIYLSLSMVTVFRWNHDGYFVEFSLKFWVSFISHFHSFIYLCHHLIFCIQQSSCILW